jgi:hypothetical protein
MGIVPVAPNSKRILFEGEKRVKGFIERFKVVGFSIIESAKRTIFVNTIDLII